jgi:hypothetical protein
MKNISTGFGLCVAAAAALAYPFVSSLAPNANASAVTAAVSAVSTAATAQAGPTIVWYGASQGQREYILWRAWSDGKVEQKMGYVVDACSGTGCVAPWVVYSAPNQGYNAASDINFDSKVDGADLGQLLADWGDAPRQDIPPSDCPLALINP